MKTLRRLKPFSKGIRDVKHPPKIAPSRCAVEKRQTPNGTWVCWKLVIYGGGIWQELVVVGQYCDTCDPET